MKTIKIFFADYWKGFDCRDNFILSALKERYRIVLEPETPDYLFYSLFGTEHFRYKNAVKIYFTGENDVPDFNLCDYGIGSSLLSFDDRYFRLPCYATSPDYGKLFAVRTEDKASLLQRKFCNFVYSNVQASDPIREKFYHLLSRYKPIDSGGKHLNNTGKPVVCKMRFIKEYKFTIAFENSSLPGYTTEKLIDPMLAESLPVYWGNPAAGADFNTKSFINLMDYASIDDAIEEIIYLDNNDAAYLDKLSQPWIEEAKRTDFSRGLSAFLARIVEQPLPEAKRTTDFGYNYFYT
ncbi:MAG: glycosyltransferase, partial [Dysgonamonadaceae bacterium]|nr:glycosyltransferase [Dysgonamonadaceae bacterium]